MHENHRTTRRRPIAAAAALLLAALLLAACGSSSSSSTASTAAAKGSTGAGANRFSAVRECLKKAGITLPERSTKNPGTGTPGTGAPPSGGGFGLGGGGTGGPKLPSGVTREQFQKALQKCGGGFRRGTGGFPGARVNSTAYKKALAKFSACMAENGVKLPTPNTSGNGPIFNTKGLNVNSATFKAAQRKCSPLVRATPGTRGPGGTGAAPEGGGGAPPPGA